MVKLYTFLTTLWGSTLREATLRAISQIPFPEQHGSITISLQWASAELPQYSPEDKSFKIFDSAVEPVDLLYPPITVF